MGAQLRVVPADAQRHALRGLALAFLGRTAEAVAEGERSAQLLPVSRNANTGAYCQQVLATIYTLVGQQGKALTVLEGLLRIPSLLSPGWLRIDPTFAPLRGDARFERLTAGR